MKKARVFFTALFLAGAATATAQPVSMAQIHFLGGEAISGDPNHLAFTKEFCSPPAVALENEALDKLARAPGAWLRAKLPAGATDGSGQLRPLLDDLLKSEWRLEIADENGQPEYCLAIRLSDARAQLWSRNLSTLLENWTGIKISRQASGWELKKDEAPNMFQFSRQGGLVVLDCGQDHLFLRDALIQAFVAGPAMNTPQPAWLEMNLDWPRLARVFPALAKFDFPVMAFQARAYGGNFHVGGRFYPSRPLPPLPAWRIPTNVIHEPFISFTAARGAGRWLERQWWFRPLALRPQPDQLFIWTLPQIPFQTFAAEPVADPNAALGQLRGNLAANTSWEGQFTTPLKVTLAGGRLSFTGTPFIAPYIQADREAHGNFLMGGFFPNTPRGQPWPPKLLAELAQPNLVYYHWEFTSQRLKELPQLTQLLLLLTNRRQLLGGSAGERWLQRVGSTWGSTVTSITEESPRELLFTRTAPGGLTAIEALALANWIESPAFPAFDLRLPRRPRLRPVHRRKMLSTPPRPAPVAPR
ncbi:MAG: hypothetical protein KGR98_07085 [Verrucomicrobia bacterium]|nr:hypothetical protein [Verrucomicrobiota bacterium]MDE3098162.1 hypothetical protein [Verrucomicrobiota bacterium]